MRSVRAPFTLLLFISILLSLTHCQKKDETPPPLKQQSKAPKVREQECVGLGCEKKECIGLGCDEQKCVGMGCEKENPRHKEN